MFVNRNAIMRRVAMKKIKVIKKGSKVVVPPGACPAYIDIPAENVR